MANQREESAKAKGLRADLKRLLSQKKNLEENIKDVRSRILEEEFRAMATKISFTKRATR